MSEIRDMCEYVFLGFLLEQIRFACKFHQIVVIYDNYLEWPIKECERVRRAKSITPVEYPLLAEDDNIPVEMDLFWASTKNKELFEVLSRNYFVGLASKEGAKIVSSGYVDDGYGTYPCVNFQNENTERCEGLKSYTEEADESIIPHIAQAAKDECQRALFITNDTDVFVLLLHYMDEFENCGVK